MRSRKRPSATCTRRYVKMAAATTMPTRTVATSEALVTSKRKSPSRKTTGRYENSASNRASNIRALSRKKERIVLEKPDHQQRRHPCHGPPRHGRRGVFQPVPIPPHGGHRYKEKRDAQQRGRGPQRGGVVNSQAGVPDRAVDD